MMAEEKRTETMIAQENSGEAAEVMGFMEMLDSHEKREFLAFIQGAKFVKSNSLKFWESPKAVQGLKMAESHADGF